MGAKRGRAALTIVFAALTSTPARCFNVAARARLATNRARGLLTARAVRSADLKRRARPVMELSTVQETAAVTVPREGKLLRPPPKFEPKPYTYLQELTLRIESLTNMGEGVARDDGWVVMVPHVIPGELVKCKVFRNHQNYSEATLTEVLEPSPDRVEPACPLFGLCGGCQYQHMQVDVQRSWKRQQVVEVLTKLAGLENPQVNPTIGTDETFGYRSKITPHYDKPRQGEIRAIGFQQVKFPTVFHQPDLGSVDLHKTVDVESCNIATPAINAALPDARRAAFEAVREAHRDGNSKKARKGAMLLFRETQEGVVTDYKAEVSERVGDLVLHFKAGEFFQNNPHVLPKMVEHVVARAKEGGARYLIDAYCGGGLFCLAASSSFERCAGIEISAPAIDCATRNAALNGIDNCLFLAGTASNIFANAHFPGDETVVIIDPPRKGCDSDFLKQLFKFKPARIVYVSCDPATQARDTESIVGSGYVPEDIQPFDLFPQTRHIENVITFSLAQPAAAGAAPASDRKRFKADAGADTGGAAAAEATGAAAAGAAAAAAAPAPAVAAETAGS